MAKKVGYKVVIDNWLTEDGLNQIMGWAREGCTDSQVAEHIGIGKSTFCEWKKKHPKITDALEKGRKPLLVDAESALYEAAIGHFTEDVDTEVYKDGKGMTHERVRKSKRWVKPEPQLLMYLLNNRRPDRYSSAPKDKKTEALMELAKKAYRGVPAEIVAPKFAEIFHDLRDKIFTEYVLPGGRGSTKSSVVSLAVVDFIWKNPECHACVLRQVGNTLSDSVYNQVQWAIDQLGLSGDFKYTKNPLEITRLSTGQKIFFRGADDPGKIKSLKPSFGYIGIIWFEELDQFGGEEAVRKIEQSLVRGGDTIYVFKSFNPPKSAQNWANQYLVIPKATRKVIRSTYLDVPPSWLGKQFIDDANFLKEVNPAAYENEYMGEANGSGGAVFDNLEIREITDEEIANFDNLYTGLDFGWYPDPTAIVRVQFDAGMHTLYVFKEYRAVKKSNEQLANVLLHDWGYTDVDVVTCDSAEPKSIADLRAAGVLAREAEKGPDSRPYSYKWLCSLRKIVIDPVRCPETAEEFIKLEYERDADGNVTSEIDSTRDHSIDAVRYAMNRVWKRRGQ